MKGKSIRNDIDSIMIDYQWFENNFILDFLISDNKFKVFLNEKRYKISDKEISSRVLNHWHELGIINDDRPDGKGWRKFSISEMIWISIINKLRSFGMSLQTIKKVKEYLDTYNSKKNQSKCPLLDYYIGYGSLSKEPVRLIVFAKGDAILLRQSALDEHSQQGLILEDYISIDINALVAKGLGSFPNRTQYTPSELSKEIKEALTIKDITSLTIRVKGKDYIIEEEFFTKDRRKANALMGVLQFGRLLEKKDAGKSTYQVTNKKKIKK